MSGLTGKASLHFFMVLPPGCRCRCGAVRGEGWCRHSCLSRVMGRHYSVTIDSVTAAVAVAIRGYELCSDTGRWAMRRGVASGPSDAVRHDALTESAVS